MGFSSNSKVPPRPSCPLACIVRRVCAHKETRTSPVGQSQRRPLKGTAAQVAHGWLGAVTPSRVYMYTPRVHVSSCPCLHRIYVRMAASCSHTLKKTSKASSTVFDNTLESHHEQGGIVRQILGAAGAFRQIVHRQSLDDRRAPSNFGPILGPAPQPRLYTVKS